MASSKRWKLGDVACREGGQVVVGIKVKVTYHWKEGSRLPIDAQAAGESLERLREDRGGRLTPDDVVISARPRRSPLHDAFEWDDSVAAKAHRLNQARYLLRSVEVVIRSDGYSGPRRQSRAFVVVSGNGDGDRSYTSVEVAMSSKPLRQQVLAQAWKELEEWRKRYEDYEELAHIFAAIDSEKGGGGG